MSTTTELRDARDEAAVRCFFKGCGRRMPRGRDAIDRHFAEHLEQCPPGPERVEMFRLQFHRMCAVMWMRDEDDRQQHRWGETKGMVLAVFERASRTWTLTELQNELLETTGDRIRPALHRLHKAGEIVRVSRGRYRSAAWARRLKEREQDD